MNFILLNGTKNREAYSLFNGRFKMPHNDSGLADVPALAFRLPSKLFKCRTKNKC